jgi:hypothetical protein
MERYPVHGITTITPADHAGRIEAFLRSQGLTTAGVTVRWNELGLATVTVTADRDPTQALAAYVPTLTPDEQETQNRIADAQAAIAEIASKPRGARSATEKARLGLAVLSEPVTAPSTPEEPVDVVDVPATGEEPIDEGGA